MAAAEAPRTSPRPMPRGLAALPPAAMQTAPGPMTLDERAARIAPPAMGVQEPQPGAGIAVSLRPRPRPTLTAPVPPAPAAPQQAVAAAPVAPVVAPPAASVAPPDPPPQKRGLFGFLRPRERQVTPPSDSLRQAAAVRPAPGLGGVTGRRGSVCGNPAILGESVAPVVGRIRGCGIERPVRVTSVGGVALSQGALMDCPTAQALHRWVEDGVKPAFARNGGGVVRMQVAAHYVCRGRNNKKGARLSEHSRGKAIDISAFTLADGTTLSVLRDWRGNRGKPVRAAHKAACGPFGTTLGPGSDGYHEDHLHLDTARHRNGPYCR